VEKSLLPIPGMEADSSVFQPIAYSLHRRNYPGSEKNASNTQAILEGNTVRKLSLEGRRRREVGCDNNTGLREVGYENRNWMELAQDHVQ
jgi:hypothetical protein